MKRAKIKVPARKKRKQAATTAVEKLDRDSKDDAMKESAPGPSVATDVTTQREREQELESTKVQLANAMQALNNISDICREVEVCSKVLLAMVPAENDKRVQKVHLRLNDSLERLADITADAVAY